MTLGLAVYENLDRQLSTRRDERTCFTDCLQAAPSISPGSRTGLSQWQLLRNRNTKTGKLLFTNVSGQRQIVTWRGGQDPDDWRRAPILVGSCSTDGRIHVSTLPRSNSELYLNIRYIQTSKNGCFAGGQCGIQRIFQLKTPVGIPWPQRSLLQNTHILKLSPQRDVAGQTQRQIAPLALGAEGSEHVARDSVQGTVTNNVAGGRLGGIAAV